MDSSVALSSGIFNRMEELISVLNTKLSLPEGKMPGWSGTKIRSGHFKITDFKRGDVTSRTTHTHSYECGEDLSCCLAAEQLILGLGAKIGSTCRIGPTTIETY